MTLGQAIIIGKRYRLNIRPNGEYIFPCCGADPGALWLAAMPQIQHSIVTVIEHSGGEEWPCRRCGKAYKHPEGLYRVLGAAYPSTGSFPYTWLTRIEEEDYDA